jgi:glutamine synthetase
MTENHTFEQVKKSLQDAGIYFVRILWCDNANIIRGKAVHGECCPTILNMVWVYPQDNKGFL